MNEITIHYSAHLTCRHLWASDDARFDQRQIYPFGRKRR